MRFVVIKRSKLTRMMTIHIEVNEDTLDDEVKNFSVDVEENFKVELEDPNEFIEVKVERNVV